MPGYTPHAVGAYTSLGGGGGNMTPAMPALNAGELLLLETGVNSTSINPPSISGWTKLTNNTSILCGALYGKIAAGGDTSPTFQWDASHQAYSRIHSFGGNVYTDLTTIVVVQNERGASTTGFISVNATSAPSQANCMAIRFGRFIKTPTTNGATFNDWSTDSGIYTKAGATQLVQNGNAIAAGLWYDQQTAATATSADGANLSTPDSAGNSQGFTLLLQPGAAASVPYPPTSLGGMNVQVCQ